MRFVVTGNLGKYAIGQVLNSPEQIADYIRTGANEGETSETPRTNEEILSAVSQIVTNENATDPEVWEGYEMAIYQAMKHVIPISVPISTVATQAATTEGQSVVDQFVVVISNLWKEAHDGVLPNLRRDVLERIVQENIEDEGMKDADWLNEIAQAIQDGEPPASLAAPSDHTAIRERMSELAIRYGDELAESAEFNTEADKDIAAKEQTKRGRLHARQYMLVKFGERLDAFPVPGSERDAKNDNLPYDKYKYLGTNSRGKPVEKVGYFYNDLVERLPRGQQITRDLEGLKKAMDGDPAAPAKFQALKTPSEKVAAENRLNQARSALRTLVKGAVNLHFQIKAIDTMPLVKLSLAWEKTADGKVLNGLEGKPAVLSDSTSPLYIIDWSDPMGGSTVNATALSINELMALRPDVAKAAGGTYQALIFSRKRSSEPGSGPDALKAETFGPVVVHLDTFLHGLESNVERMAAIVPLLKIESEEMDDLLLSLESVRDATDYIVTSPLFKARIIKVRAKRDAAAKSAGTQEGTAGQTKTGT